MLAEQQRRTPFALPAEWEEQSAVMLTWPHRETIWEETLDDIDLVFAQVAVEIAKRENVIISCFDEAHRQHIEHRLKKAGLRQLNHIAIHIAPCNDVWVRDHGPVCVLRDGRPLLLDFEFNGWGNKYPAELDNQITRTLHAKHAFGDTPLQSIPLVLEGGAIEVDSNGTLLTTRRCLLARNPALSEAQLETQLRQLFGIHRILWLEHGYLSGDDTDGHIDTLARFVDPHTICYVQCNDRNDEHYAAFQAMEAQLRTFTDYQGNPYRLIPLPWPQARYAAYDNRRLPVTYANFLLINKAILVPTYDDPADSDAIALFSQLFPTRDIIEIPCLPVVQWYGSLHCMTMQLPAGV